MAVYNSRRRDWTSEAMSSKQLADMGYRHVRVEINPRETADSTGIDSCWASDQGLDGLGDLGTNVNGDGHRVFNVLGTYFVQFHLSAILPGQDFVTANDQMSLPVGQPGRMLHLGLQISSPQYRLDVVRPSLQHADCCTCTAISGKARIGGSLDLSLELRMDGLPVDLEGCDLQALRLESIHLDSG